MGYKVLSHQNYGGIIEILSGDYPFVYKAVGVVALSLDGLIVVSAAPLAVVAADGLVDVYKGTHHYLGMQIGKRTTRDPQSRQEIQKGIDDMIVASEKPIK